MDKFKKLLQETRNSSFYAENLNKIFNEIKNKGKTLSESDIDKYIIHITKGRKRSILGSGYSSLDSVNCLAEHWIVTPAQLDKILMFIDKVRYSEDLFSQKENVSLAKYVVKQEHLQILYKRGYLDPTKILEQETLSPELLTTILQSAVIYTSKSLLEEVITKFKINFTNDHYDTLLGNKHIERHFYGDNETNDMYHRVYYNEDMPTPIICTHLDTLIKLGFKPNIETVEIIINSMPVVLKRDIGNYFNGVSDLIKIVLKQCDAIITEKQCDMVIKLLFQCNATRFSMDTFSAVYVLKFFTYLKDHIQISPDTATKYFGDILKYLYYTHLDKKSPDYDAGNIFVNHYKIKITEEICDSACCMCSTFIFNYLYDNGLFIPTKNSFPNMFKVYFGATHNTQKIEEPNNIVEKLLNMKVMPETKDFLQLEQYNCGYVNLILSYGMKVTYELVDILCSKQIMIDNLDKYDITIDDRIYFICHKYDSKINLVKNRNNNKYGDIKIIDDERHKFYRNIALTYNIVKFKALVMNSKFKPDQYCYDNALACLSFEHVKWLEDEYGLSPTPVSIMRINDDDKRYHMFTKYRHLLSMKEEEYIDRYAIKVDTVIKEKITEDNSETDIPIVSEVTAEETLVPIAEVKVKKTKGKKVTKVDVKEETLAPDVEVKVNVKRTKGKKVIVKAKKV